MIDAQTASQKALDYFRRIHGTLAVWGFEIEDASKEPEGETWLVRCSFLPTINAADRYVYELTIDAQDGTILQVKRLQDQKAAG